MRWLAHRGDAEVQAVYLDRRSDWNAGEGHPWPLIQHYRGALLAPTDRAAAAESALAGSEIAFAGEHGPIVRLIGAGCRVAASFWSGHPWPEAHAEIERLRPVLPHARRQLDALSAGFDHAAGPLVCLREVLPFNFR